MLLVYWRGKGSGVLEQNKRTKKEASTDRVVNPEFYRLNIEWRISKMQEDYKLYSEPELRKF
ncbi:hypothetical protein F4782DRAFT_505103, partial [Xylaria castorea]